MVTPLDYSRCQLTVFALAWSNFLHSANSSECFISRVGLVGVKYSMHDENSIILGVSWGALVAQGEKHCRDPDLKPSAWLDAHYTQLEFNLLPTFVAEIAMLIFYFKVNVYLCNPCIYYHFNGNNNDWIITSDNAVRGTLFYILKHYYVMQNIAFP